MERSLNHRLGVSHWPLHDLRRWVLLVVVVMWKTRCYADRVRDPGLEDENVSAYSALQEIDFKIYEVDVNHPGNFSLLVLPMPHMFELQQ